MNEAYELHAKFVPSRKILMATIGTDIAKAKDLLERGELVAIPTETVYGLAANGLQANAVLQIFEVKQRPSFDPLIMHVADKNSINLLAKDIPPSVTSLVEDKWPGPLTLVLNKKPLVPDVVTSGLDTVAIRLPNHPLSLELLAQLDFPLAAPSANPFGYVSPTNAQHVDDQLGSHIQYILDGGPCIVGVESTIVDLTNSSPVVLRLGAVTSEQLVEHLGHVEINTHSTSNPSAPGMLSSHYSPSKKLLLGDLRTLYECHIDKNPVVICFKDRLAGVEDGRQIVLSEKGDISEAARNLFAALRQLDDLDAELVIAEEVPNQGIGLAINDRLKRASANN